MKKRNLAKRWKSKVFDLWLSLSRTYLEMKSKPSVQTFCRLLKFLAKILVKLFIRRLFD